MIPTSKFFNSINNSFNIYLNKILSNNSGYIRIESNDVEISGNLIINGNIQIDGSHNIDIPDLIVNTDSLIEGSSNLFFTESRARESINIVNSDLSRNDKITYDISSGTITYTGIDLSLLQPNIIAGNGIDISNNVISILEPSLNLYNNLINLTSLVNNIDNSVNYILDIAINDISQQQVITDQSINILQELYNNLDVSNIMYGDNSNIKNIYNQTAILKSDIIISQSNHEYNSKRIDILNSEIDSFKLNYYSDEKIKHNKIPIKNALQTIEKLQAYSYSINTNLSQGKPDDNHCYIKQCGYIAQDILKIPELSHSVTIPINQEQLYRLNYQNIFVYQSAAIKELHDIVKRQGIAINLIIKELKNKNNII